jgi:hypothetical protein
MWETTFPRLTNAGLIGQDLTTRDVYTQPHVIFVNGLAQSGVGKVSEMLFPTWVTAGIYSLSHELVPNERAIIVHRVSSIDTSA